MGLKTIWFKSACCRLFIYSGLSALFVFSSNNKVFTSTNHLDPFTGPKATLKSRWVGYQKAPFEIPILIMAGHADSQGAAGAGTAGESVDLKGAKPMDSSMSDELFWNLMVTEAVVKIGRSKGLNISSYDPEVRNIIDGNDPRTNWSIGAKHARRGGYPIEIHFDSYGEYGFGSGLIPPISRNLNLVDESLAEVFGKYPMFFRGGLGAPRREIRVLEIAKLEGYLERDLRNPSTRNVTINKIANKIVNALIAGLRS